MAGSTVVRERIVYVLAALAVVQIGVLAFSRGGPAAGPPDPVEAGYDFGAVRVTDEAGRATPLAADGPTLVLVFHSECGHCATVAPVWSEWLRARPADMNVVAVSREPLATARAYAESHDWAVDVRSVSVGALGTREHALTRRTPWVFAIDARGRMIAGAHGAVVDAVASALRTGHRP